MWATKFDMGLFARYLGGELGLPVIDQTSLTGVYDLKLAWNPDEGKIGGEADSRPSMVTAVKEQLGLELKRGKGQVEMVVVDYAEKASAN
jgi:bla regulator protein blaR1